MMINFDHESRLYFGLYEIEIARHVKKLLKSSKTSFDIGANAGYYSLVFAKYTKGEVLAVEASNNSSEDLTKNLSKNSYKIVELNTLVDSTNGQGSSTLDYLAETYFYPDFIKIDIEGGEMEALKGAKTLLSQHHPHLIIEVHSKDLENHCEKFLRRYGYNPIRKAPRTILKEERPANYNGWLICKGNPKNF